MSIKIDWRVAAVAVAGFGFLGQPANAAQPPRVPAYSCPGLAAQLGAANVWQTAFWAWRYDVFGDREDIDAVACFASEADCTAWLYWAQSDWDHIFPPPLPCRRGID
jgi:hypothetical protein